jgi:hypothetical protein
MQLDSRIGQNAGNSDSQFPAREIADSMWKVPVRFQRDSDTGILVDNRPNTKTDRRDRLLSPREERNHQARERALNAPREDVPTSPPLSKTEEKDVAEIVKNFKTYREKDEAEQVAGGADFAKAFEEALEAHAALTDSLNCKSRDQLKRLLPAVNKLLEAEGFRMADVPGLNEVRIGRFDQKQRRYIDSHYGVSEYDLAKCGL